jgi:PTH1 family peptidyl-tRNA hydrolase
MKLVVGLGNPGDKYKDTRHNVGFMVMDKIQSTDMNGFGMPPFRLENQYNARITQTGGVGVDRITIAKPQTFMNLSGESVRKMKDYFKLEDEDIVVVCDDLNLPVGTVRVRFDGESGGHNGLKSIIDNIGNNFWRIKVGIGSNKPGDDSKQQMAIPAEKYVLAKFGKDEMKSIERVVDKTAQYVLQSISSGIKEETFTAN